MGQPSPIAPTVAASNLSQLTTPASLARSPAPTTPADFEQQIYAALLSPGDRVFDIGANAGDVSVYAAHLVGNTGEVIAFEPVWTMYAHLCRRIQGDGAGRAPIIPVNVGISDTEQTAIIHVPADIFGLGSLAPADIWSKVNDGKAIKGYPCRFVPLDSFMNATGATPPAFVKIDVEGAELFVLRSMSKLLADHKPTILAEVFAPFERLFNYAPWDVLSFLQNAGYEFYFMCPEGLVAHVPTKDEPMPAAYTMGYNIVAFSRAAHPEIPQRLAHLLPGSKAIMPMVLPSYANE